MENATKTREVGRVKDFATAVKGGAGWLAKLEKVAHRCESEERVPVATVIECGRTYFYGLSVLLKAIELRDNVHRWEKQWLHVEGIVADLNAQLIEAGAQQNGQRLQ
jgi:hypothetical protein